MSIQEKPETVYYPSVDVPRASGALEGRGMVERIGRFEIQECIEETAVGRAYRAVDPSLGRPVVIATIRVPNNLSDAARDAMLREVRLVGALSHPNIATVFDAGIEDDLAFLAAERIEGQTLASRIAEAAPFRAVAILPWLEQLADSIDYAHRRGVVHRDLTPSNIYLSTVGQIKVANFGLARLSLAADLSHTAPVGNPNYMSPEQVKGDAVDQRSDIYALGVVVFELLTGKLPFDGGTLVSTIYKVVNQEIPRMEDLAPGVDPKLDDVLAKALSKASEDRFDSARALVEALRDVAQTHTGSGAATEQNEMTIRYCDQCGTALKANVKYCYKCGSEAVAHEEMEVGAVITKDDTPTVKKARPPQDSTVPLAEAPVSRGTEKIQETPKTARVYGTLPLAGYAASTGSRELPPPGAEIDTPPSKMSSLSGLLLPLFAIVSVILIAGVGGYMLAPRLVGANRVAVWSSEANPEPTEAAPEAPAPIQGPYPVAIVLPESKSVVNGQNALGPADGKFAGIAPQGYLTISFRQGEMMVDDGSTKPDLSVSGTGEVVSYTIAVRRDDGNFQVVDKVKKFGPSDMNHHKIAKTTEVKIINTGATELLVDSVEALNPLAPVVPAPGA